MKRTKTITLTAVITAIFLGATIFSACTKTNNSDPCASVSCQNGGTCNAGVCTCPTGYTGSFCQTAATTQIEYVNKTFTPISITVNGANQTIPVAGSVFVSGSYGVTETATAYTSGTTISGGVLGTVRNWSLSDVFPATGSIVENLNVSSSVFFLQIKNTTSYPFVTLYVNYGLASQTAETVNIPNDGQTYNIGYYLAYTNSNVRVESTSYFWSSNLTLPFTANQGILVTF